MREYVSGYNVDEVAEILKVSKQSIRRMIRDEKIKARKVGKSYLIPRSEVDSLVYGGKNMDFYDTEIALRNEIERLKLENQEYQVKFEMMKRIFGTIDLMKSAS